MERDFLKWFGHLKRMEMCTEEAHEYSQRLNEEEVVYWMLFKSNGRGKLIRKG